MKAKKTRKQLRLDELSGITKTSCIKVPDDSFLLVRVGSDNRPATTTDIEDVAKQLDKVFSAKFPDLLAIVTHHNVDIRVIRPGKSPEKK